MAEPVYLKLEIDRYDIEGESTKSSMDREGSIECSTYHQEVKTSLDPVTGQPSGKRQVGAVTISKRIDKTTPLLIKALCERVPQTGMVDAEFRFFRMAVGGSGAEEHYYTVLARGGHIASVDQLSEDPIAAGDGAPPMMEQVSFVFPDITWTYEIGGATHHER
jgi:type VI secretion system secreted protein Hcp